MIGIYKITNKINNKVYIGQSIDIEKRWRAHIYRSTKEEYQEYLYQAIRKYGINKFDFSIIEECSSDQLDEREQYWIEYYDSYKNGYNMTIGGNGNRENCEKANEKRKVAVLAYQLDGTFYKEFESISLASRETGVHIFVIEQCLNGNNQRGGNYQWKKKEDNFEEKISSYQKRIKSTAVKIEQYDLNNNLLNTFNSILEASKITGVSRRSIMRVCNGEQNSTKGYIWKRKEV